MRYSSYTIEEMDSYAQEEGGICLTRTLLDNWKKLTWKCRNGHQFEMLASEVRQGAWCPQCEAIEKVFPVKKKAGNKKNTRSRAARREKQLERLRIIAAGRGGKCLSDVYINNDTKMKFECSEGHVWETIPSSILRKNKAIWCPVCAGKAPRSIEDMREIAAKRGGKCLSEKYVNTVTKLKWECSEGHVWESTPAIVSRGSWCAQCIGVKKLTLEEMREIAESRGGKCLSDKYVNNHTKLRWQCSEGHVWEQHAMHIRSGGRCSKCAGVQKLTIDEMQELAERRGGKCLSTEYVNGSTKLKWQCKEGHVFEAEPGSIKNQKTWCPECFYFRLRGMSKALKLDLKEMHELAAQHGGKCLSDRYVNPRTKLKWECKEGHVFEAEPRSIKYQGTWCRECYHIQRRRRDWMKSASG